MTYRTKFTTGIVTGALLLGSFAPIAFADVNTTISGNGDHSNNTLNVTQNVTTNITQSNTAVFSNTVNGTANTGGNNANENTGGDVMVTSGNATVDVNITNTNGGNVAILPHVPSPINVTTDISGNGSHSKNKADVKNNTKVNATQSNTCVVTNTVTKKAKTGKNKANKNTDGNVTVISGDANASANLTNDCGFNVLNPVIE